MKRAAVAALFIATMVLRFFDGRKVDDRSAKGEEADEAVGVSA